MAVRFFIVSVSILLKIIFYFRFTFSFNLELNTVGHVLLHRFLFAIDIKPRFLHIPWYIFVFWKVGPQNTQSIQHIVAHLSKSFPSLIPAGEQGLQWSFIKKIYIVRLTFFVLDYLFFYFFTSHQIIFICWGPISIQLCKR